MMYLMLFVTGAVVMKFWTMLRVRRILDQNTLVDRYPEPDDKRYTPSVRSLIRDMRKVRKVTG